MQSEANSYSTALENHDFMPWLTCRMKLNCIVGMGDSRICSRGFPGSFVVHGALARWKFFIITTPTFHIIVVLIMIQ